MKPGPQPEPHPATRTVFAVHSAKTLGLSRSRLRARDLDSSVYGVRGPAESDDQLDQRCRMFALRLPNEVFFSHVTSALLMGAPLPWELERNPQVHVTVPTPQRAPHASGLIGHSRATLTDDITVTRGIRHGTPERTWCELASVLDIPDLVAVGDHLIHHRAAWTSSSRLATRVLVGDRISRSRRLVHALELLDPHSESRPESLLRVLLHGAGLKQPNVNRVVVRTETGRNIRCDFSFASERVAIEYQGDYHRTASQWRDDMTRRGRLEAHGWYVLEVNFDDLKNAAELADRIRRILARRQHLIALEARDHTL